MESDKSDFESEPSAQFSRPRQDHQPEPGSRRVRGKGKEWKTVKTCKTEDEIKEGPTGRIRAPRDQGSA